MNRERMTVWADFLDDVPQDQFDMDTWWCGTAGCAAGWAARIPEFAEAGFGLTGSGANKQPCYQDEVGENAVAEFFGLNPGVMDRIVFSTCLTPSGIARLIREILAEDDNTEGPTT